MMRWRELGSERDYKGDMTKASETVPGLDVIVARRYSLGSE